MWSERVTKQSIFNQILGVNDPHTVATVVREYGTEFPTRKFCVEQASHIVSVLENSAENEDVVQMVAERLDTTTIDHRVLYERMPKALQSLISFR